MNWKSHLVTFVLIFLVVVLFAQTCRPRSQAGPGRPPDARLVPLVLDGTPEGLSVASYTIQAEVADTQQKRRQGLSGRAGLEPGFGMLYVYEEPQQPEFSQAATRCPLSVAFLRDDGTIAEVRRTEAGDPSVFRPAEPVRYVLEVRAGWFEDRNAGPGARFRLAEALSALAAPPTSASEVEAAQSPPPSQP